MSVGGIGADLPMMLPDPAAAADVAAPAVPVLPEPAAPPAPPLPAMLADGFTAATRDPVAHLIAGADANQTAALSDLRAAKRDLRQARHEPAGTAGRRADIREARRDVRAAKADVQDAAATANMAHALGDAVDAFDATDAFAGPPADRHLLGADGLDVAGQRGLALGRGLPNINQLNPAGKELGYFNGDMNCAPAAMAMVARGRHGGMLDGKAVGHMSDAELINRLGKHGQTDRLGTSPNGVVAMAEELGMTTSTRQGGFDQAYFDSILAKGGSVVANGAYPINGEMAGHFMTVTAKTQDGNYLVNDPLLGQTVTYTPAQLDQFLRNNPVYGGVSIGVF